MSPFQALYGQVPPHMIRLVRFGHRQTMVDALDQMLQEREAMLDEI